MDEMTVDEAVGIARTHGGEFALALVAEIERLRAFITRCHTALAGKQYDPKWFDDLALEAAAAAAAEGKP